MHSGILFYLSNLRYNILSTRSYELFGDIACNFPMNKLQHSSLFDRNLFLPTKFCKTLPAREFFGISDLLEKRAIKIGICKLQAMLSEIFERIRRQKYIIVERMT